MAETPPPSDDLPAALAANAPVEGEARSRAGHWLAWLAGLSALGAMLVLAGFLVFLDSLSRQETEFGRSVDGIAALTGGPDRIGDALSVLEEGRAKRLLISGVNTQITDAVLIRKSGHQNLFQCCIDIGRSALNTVGNAIETANWARRHGYRSILVVTSNYHMPRAMVELRRHLKNVELVAHPVINDSVRPDLWWQDAGLARLLFGEYLKYLVAEARSRLVPDDPPAP